MVVGPGKASVEQAARANECQRIASEPYQPRSEQVMVDMIREDLGVSIDPMAWRMFIRHRFTRLSPLAHRIHDGKR